MGAFRTTVRQNEDTNERVDRVSAKGTDQGDGEVTIARSPCWREATADSNWR